MSDHRRRATVLVLALGFAAGAAAVTGHAASLQVDSARLDAYGSTQAAPTTTASTVPTDTTAPSLTTLEMFDDDADGFVDRVLATFDETLAAYTAGTTPWTLANVPSGGALASVSVSGYSATLTLTEGAGPRSTAVGSFTVALAQSATGIRDAAGNRSSFSAAAPTDRAKPIPVSLDIPNGAGTNNKATQGDTVVVVWSEKLLATSICATGFNDTTAATYDANLNQSTFVRIRDHAEAPATAHDTLTASFNCGSFRFGSVGLGSTAYTTASRSFGDNANAGRARATWNPTTSTFTLTLGKLDGTDVLGTVSTSVTATYTPDTGLTDLAGNTATGTVSKTDTHF